MPRKSAAARAVAPAFAREPVPVQPPATLSEAAKRIFIELVSDCDPRHFVPSDVGLLCQYCEAQVMAERAAAELQKGEGPPNARWLAAWREGTRAMKDLSLRLRLSPQSRREKAKVPDRPLTWSERFRLEHDGRL
jgi:phage terminase small subunit